MKIIHCSDIHLDSPLTGNFPAEKSEERRNEILLTFIRMVKYARGQGVRAIIIAGDWFDDKRISPSTASILTKCLIDSPEIDFLYLSGNHDKQENLGAALIKRVFGKAPANLKILDGNVIRLEDDIVVAGVFTPDELDLDPGDTNIVVYHGEIDPAAWKHREIDYLALGHYHSLKEGRLDARGIYCYSGSIEGRGFDECGEKGFIRLDIAGRENEPKKITPTFVKASKRTIHAIDLDISGLRNTGEIDARIEEALVGISPSDMIKISLCGNAAMDSERNLSYLEKKYGEVFYLVRIDDKRVVTGNYKNTIEYDKSLKGEFIREVMKAGYSEEVKNAVIEAGLAALSGAEIR
ncbi:MAG: metallophosphoesterase family protein [Lachnospiraceae bacterium]|nr:metallophosphoesterase family protein [Lachnospiraceae bacterium]